MLPLMDTEVSLTVKVLWKFISLLNFYERVSIIGSFFFLSNHYIPYLICNKKNTNKKKGELRRAMKTYIHGTSYENAMNIMTNGLLREKDTVWTCSDPDYIYVFDSDDKEAFSSCIGAGQITAAYQNSMSDKIAIIRFEMTESVADRIISNDISCENMYDSYQISIAELNMLLKSGEIQLYVDIYNDSYIPYLRVFYLPIDNPYMELSDPLLLSAVKTVNNTDAVSYLVDDLLYYGEKDCTMHKKIS